MTSFLRRLRARIKYRHFERELPREIEAHRAMAEAALEKSGVEPVEARHAASRALGNTTLAREDSRAIWIPVYAQQVAQDARYALRMMRRQPGFTIAAILMLTLGIGLVAGGYTVFNGLFIRGWNLPDADKVFKVTAAREQSGEGFVRDGFSLGAYKHLRANAKAADYVAMTIDYFRIRPDGVEGQGTHTEGMFATDNVVEALRIPMQLGSGFGAMPPPTEARILISDRVWRRNFAADPDIIGKTAWLSNVPAVIIGVTAPGFDGLGPRELGFVAEMSSGPRWSRGRGAGELVADETECCVILAGRLREGWSRDQAREELDGLAAHYRQAMGLPSMSIALAGTTPGDDIAGTSKGHSLRIVLTLIGAGLLLVMLLTCANVGNLFLARSLRREREIAVRLSLGASRPRVVRQLLTEGTVLAAIAGTGAFLATTSVPVILRLIEDDASTSMFASDWRVAAATGAAAVIAALLVSLAPALQTTRIAWRGANATMSGRTGRTRGVVLALQIAIAAVLVLSGTLVARGIQHALTAPADFALHTTTAVTLRAPAEERYTTRSMEIWKTLDKAARQQGLRVGFANVSPVSGRLRLRTSLRRMPSDVMFQADLLPLSTTALQILDVPLAAGRWASEEPASGEAVINETLANRMWPGESAIGKTVGLSFNQRPYVIVGVTRDAHLTTLTEVEPLIHTAPLASLGLPVLLIRTGPGSDEAIRRLVAAANPALDITLTPLSATVKQTIEQALIGASIAGGLGVIALLLAVIGVFGVFSYLIEERRREIGIRLALGASRGQIGRALLQACRGPVAGGLIAGLVLSALAGTALRGFLFGLSPADPISYAATALILVIAALLATAIPVRRALRVNPAVTLKAE